MKTVEIFINEINELFKDCKNKIIEYSIEIKNEKGLQEFYNKSLFEFYRLMPYYSFYIYFENLSYEDSLEVNNYGLTKSKELHDLYSQIFLQKRREFIELNNIS